jgi:hypothetical protein
MYFPSAIRTSFGRPALRRWPMVRISLTHVFICAIERDASTEQEEHQSVAEYLTWCSVALREATR